MFAVIRTGGKQYRIEPGSIIQVEKMEGDVGSSVTLDDILLVGGDSTSLGDTIGKSLVKATIIGQSRGEKVLVFKKKRRHNYRRKNGHRQYLTSIEINGITGPDGKTSEAPARNRATAAPQPVVAKSNARKTASTNIESAASAEKPAKTVSAKPVKQVAAEKPAVKEPAGSTKPAVKDPVKKAPAKKDASAAPAAEKKPAAKKPAAKKTEK